VAWLLLLQLLQGGGGVGGGDINGGMLSLLLQAAHRPLDSRLAPAAAVVAPLPAVPAPQTLPSAVSGQHALLQQLASLLAQTSPAAMQAAIPEQPAAAADATAAPPQALMDQLLLQVAQQLLVNQHQQQAVARAAAAPGPDVATTAAALALMQGGAVPASAAGAPLAQVASSPPGLALHQIQLAAAALDAGTTVADSPGTTHGVDAAGAAAVNPLAAPLAALQTVGAPPTSCDLAAQALLAAAAAAGAAAPLQPEAQQPLGVLGSEQQGGSVAAVEAAAAGVGEMAAANEEALRNAQVLLESLALQQQVPSAVDV